MTRLEEMKDLPRVELPADVLDDGHNRIAGLLDLIHDCFNPSSLVVEIGTGMGVSTEVFALTVGRVITIDPYFPGSERWRDAAIKVCRRYPDKITQCFDKSAVVCRTIQNGSVDGVYIDGDHHFESVRDDILRWLPKLKPDGWMCGHDYIARPKYNFGIIEAVNACFGKPRKVYSDFSWVA
ncbi:MAG: class I SAM-dependent methyltransferase [Thiothrix sp.]|uniref:class I SAM-dependent methyltransferase n=1 Tax=Thiothrix sp. TaxID=1032 RepID=UPI002603849B|nr:class I SAM-dependent methyltransferase [Thiothrix sp.]MDD5394924.1 class I SAM-dependent methyltransferase [Thiothrix sp.]